MFRLAYLKRVQDRRARPRRIQQNADYGFELADQFTGPTPLHNDGVHPRGMRTASAWHSFFGAGYRAYYRDHCGRCDRRGSSRRRGKVVTDAATRSRFPEPAPKGCAMHTCVVEPDVAAVAASRPTEKIRTHRAILGSSGFATSGSTAARGLKRKVDELCRYRTLIVAVYSAGAGQTSGRCHHVCDQIPACAAARPRRSFGCEVPRSMLSRGRSTARAYAAVVAYAAYRRSYGPSTLLSDPRSIEAADVRASARQHFTDAA